MGGAQYSLSGWENFYYEHSTEMSQKQCKPLTGTDFHVDITTGTSSGDYDCSTDATVRLTLNDGGAAVLQDKELNSIGDDFEQGSTQDYKVTTTAPSNPDEVCIEVTDWQVYEDSGFCIDKLVFHDDFGAVGPMTVGGWDLFLYNSDTQKSQKQCKPLR